MNETKKQLISETLAWCNQIRVERGLELLTELPRGIPADPVSCPCGKATGAKVGVYFYTFEDGLRSCDVPVQVRDFIRAFDNLAIPELLEDGWRD